MESAQCTLAFKTPRAFRGSTRTSFDFIKILHSTLESYGPESENVQKREAGERYNTTVNPQTTNSVKVFNRETFQMLLQVRQLWVLKLLFFFSSRTTNFCLD